MASHHGLPLDLASLTRRIVEQTLDPATSAAERAAERSRCPLRRTAVRACGT